MCSLVAELHVVKKGTYPSLDMVFCPVPGCPLGTGTGLLRESVPDHFNARTRAATHAAWIVQKPTRAPATRKRKAKLAPETLQARLAGFFLKPAERQAAAAEVAPQEEEEPAQEEELAQEEMEEPPVDAVAAPASRSLLAQLADVPRLLVSLIGEVRRLPAAIVAAQREAEAMKSVAAAAARIKGATLAEVAEKNGLVLEEGVLKCLNCVHHAPRLSGGRSGQQQPGCFDASRRLAELKADLSKHFQRASHVAACNAAAEKARRDKSAASAGWNIGRAVYHRACSAVPRCSMY